jgi:hypothetical protein
MGGITRIIADPPMLGGATPTVDAKAGFVK